MSVELLPIDTKTFDLFLQDSSIGQMVRHPLYNTSAGNLEIKLDDSWKKMFKEKEVQDRVETYKDYHIERIKIKQEFLKKALKEKDYSQALFLIEAPYRLSWILENHQLFKNDAKEYFNILKDAYTQAEFPLSGLSKKQIQKLFYFHKNPKLMMDKDERKRLKKLPKQITFFRGIKVSNDKSVNEKNLGFSFSLDKKMAEWFAKRLLLPNDEAYLITAKAHKKDIISFFDVRNEDEIIVDPDKLIEYKIQKLKKEKISQEDIFTRNLQQNYWS